MAFLPTRFAALACAAIVSFGMGTAQFAAAETTPITSQVPVPPAPPTAADTGRPTMVTSGTTGGAVPGSTGSAPASAPATAPSSAATSATVSTAKNQPNDCTKGGGVFVVIEKDKSIIRSGCAKNPKNGVEALKQIGAKVGTKPAGSMGEMVCSIDDQPADGCSAAFTGNYWAYFHANPSGSELSEWVLSDLGAASYQPKTGSMEGWNYGTGTAPLPVLAAQPAATSSATASVEPQPGKTGGSTPFGLIVVLLLLGFGLGGAVAYWLAKRKKNPVTAEPSTVEPVVDHPVDEADPTTTSDLQAAETTTAAVVASPVETAPESDSSAEQTVVAEPVVANAEKPADGDGQESAVNNLDEVDQSDSAVEDQAVEKEHKPAPKDKS